MSMRLRYFSTIAVTLFGLLHAAPDFDSAVTIDRYGREIQLDGFLMEWDQARARPLAGTTRILWDAVNTPRGFAGYFYTDNRDSCSVKQARIYPDMRALHRYHEIDFSQWPHENEFCAIHSPDSGNTIIAEFFIEWDRVLCDSSGSYRIGAIAYGTCGDIFGPIVWKGTRESKLTLVLTPAIKIRIAIILALLAAYIVTYRRVRRKIPRKGSPRR